MTTVTAIYRPFLVAVHSFLARISKMPVQNSNFKIFACPDLATYLLQIPIPPPFNRLVSCPNRRFIGNYLSKRQVGRVLDKSLAVHNTAMGTHWGVPLYKCFRQNPCYKKKFPTCTCTVRLIRRTR